MWSQIDTKLNRAIAVCAVLGIIWSVLEYTETRPVTWAEAKQILTLAQENNRALLIIQYNNLIDIRKTRQLTTEEQVKLCLIVQALNIKDAACI